MPQMPKRVKYRKVQRKRKKGNAVSNTRLAFGDFGLKALEPGQISAQTIEAARTSVTRYLKRHGKLWIKIFPDRPYTKKPLETRMGKGKGPPEGWQANVQAGNVLLELSGVNPSVARAALARAANKMPVRCKFISREAE